MTDAAGVASGGSRREHLLALDEDDVGHPAAGQMVGHARAHAPTADDDHFRCTFHLACHALSRRLEGTKVTKPALISFTRRNGGNGAPRFDAVGLRSRPTTRPQAIRIRESSRPYQIRVSGSLSAVARRKSGAASNRSAFALRGLRGLCVHIERGSSSCVLRVFVSSWFRGFVVRDQRCVVGALPPPCATRSTCSMTRRMLPPRILCTSASE